MIELDAINAEYYIPKAGDVIVIQRKADSPDRKILCKVLEVYRGSSGPEIILSGKNDYFIWDMYINGESWVWRVWNLGSIEITSITNTFNEFPRG